MKWISMSTKLPVVDTSVLACDINGDMQIIIMRVYSGRSVIEDYGGFTLVSDSIYKWWQPLPNQPEGIIV